ncbi:MAG: methyltransferase domain-containing protein [Erysipelotrichaceae bacterium]
MEQIKYKGKELLSLYKDNPEAFHQYLKVNKLTYDYLNHEDFRILQDDSMFHFNSDTAHLAHFMKIKTSDDVLDIGTNNGALLLYAARFTKKRLVGVEIQEKAAQLAQINMEMHEIKDFNIVTCDIKDYPKDQFNVIICNPPYFKLSEQIIEPTSKQIARHELYLDLDTLLKQFERLCSDSGRIYFVHRGDRLAEIIEKLHNVHIEVKTLQIIYDENKEEARGILIEAIKQAKPGIKILKPIINQR